MQIAPVLLPPPVYGHPIEMALLEQVRRYGAELVLLYMDKYTKDGLLFVGRDAAKRIFPEYLEDSTRHNRYTDGAASAIADAARRTLLARPLDSGRKGVVILTGAPASGKTGSAGPSLNDWIEMKHETILTSLPRSIQLVEESFDAGRDVAIHLFYTDDPRINLRRMVRRAIRIGRTVPLRYMAETYLSVPALVAELATRFGRRLQILVTNNSESPGLSVAHHNIERALYHVNRYNQYTVLEAMHAELDEIAGAGEGLPEAVLAEALR